MDPVSHVVVAWSLNGLVGRVASTRPTRPTGPTSPTSPRGIALASALGALSPDIDLLFMPAGWDRYLVAHEIGTHSLAGAVLCGVAAAGVASLIRGRAAWRPLVLPAVIGATSHIAADLLSGAAIRVGWPLADERVANVGVVAMGEPLVLAGSVLAALTILFWRAYQRLVGIVFLSAFALLTLEKTIVREYSELTYRQHPARAAAVGDYLVQPVWGSMLEWRIFDRTATSARAWTIDPRAGATVVVEVPLTNGNTQLVAASRQWDTVRNFQRAHAFAFAVATDDGVEWSDLRYCEPGAPAQVPACAVWAGGEFATPPTLHRLLVRVGSLVQTR
jgi:membrane-bound metal-dependent hydrolase YbcI (DUF457 family)